ncbi:Trypanosomal VSG domain containing protein, putative [Trypanosoma equiperdum]|uniref:Trypanosomal VSG domain containing protein, putative n=1 Tax=Trypanosoma equiperdum TaxID=5694 RepID=A0A1G4I7G4_TRYEQ|nr:Trypanosomal VSG domain containing protein, putative [Trypanosoma equiperdum]
MVAEQAYKLHEKLVAARTKLNADKINDKLKEALYGPKMNAKEVKTAGGTRQATCGPTGGTGGAAAGASLAMDLLCICGKHSSDVSGHKACGKDWNTGAVATTNWDPTQDASTIIADLLTKCQLQTSKTTLSKAELQTAMSKFLHRISIARGSAGAKRRMLGTLDGTGAGQCSGYQDGTNGPCVQYKAAHLTGPDMSLPWYVELKEAHDSWEAATQTKGDIRRLEAQLKALNLTANSLQLETQTAHKKEVTIQAEAETLTSKQKECEAIQAAADCRKNGNCKWEGADDKGGKHYKLNTTAIERAETQVGTGAQTGKTCTDHTKKEIVRLITLDRNSVKNPTAVGLKESSRIPVYL